jgi:hypothetical protein
MEEIQIQVAQDSPNLHQFISDRNIKCVLKFIAENPQEKVVVCNGHSAIAWSLKCGFFEIYEILVATDFKFAEDEDFKKVLDFLEKNAKAKNAKAIKLREINRKYMKETTKKHLLRLNLMSKLAPTTPENKRREYDKIVTETFEALNEIPEIEKIMKYVSSAKGEMVK